MADDSDDLARGLYERLITRSLPADFFFFGQGR
jgi:hypothetical protein